MAIPVWWQWSTQVPLCPCARVIRPAPVNHGGNGYWGIFATGFQNNLKMLSGAGGWEASYCFQTSIMTGGNFIFLMTSKGSLAMDLILRSQYTLLCSSGASFFTKFSLFISRLGLCAWFYSQPCGAVVKSMQRLANGKDFFLPFRDTVLSYPTMVTPYTNYFVPLDLEWLFMLSPVQYSTVV